MQFFPPADRDQLELQVFMPAGTSIHKTAQRVQQIEAAVQGQPGVESLTWVVGASSPPVYYNQVRDQDQNPSYARAVIKAAEPALAKSLEQVLQDTLPTRFPDAQLIVKAFGQGPPISAPIAFRIVGPDADRLREFGEQLRALIHEQPQVLATRAAVTGGEPKLWLEADESQARLAGLSLGEVAGQFQTALDGAVGGSLLEDLEELPVRIRYSADERSNVDTLATLRLQSSNDAGWVPAEALGEFALKPELAEIYRRNGERVNEVLGFLRQGALPIEVTRAINARLDANGLDLPPGYRLETAGDSAEQQNAVGQLLTYVPVLGVLMIATLVLTFRSALLATLIGVVAVFSVGLGMLSLWLGGYPLGFNPIIGSAGLVGVAINGSIVVLAALRANTRARDGDVEAIISETLGTTRHIVSTTITTVAGFAPLLLLSGGDFWPPLAIVIAGGVGFSIVLSLVFTPSVYYLLYGNPHKAQATEGNIVSTQAMNEGGIVA
jgi:multidrug efflux pump subunit AcrB